MNTARQDILARIAQATDEGSGDRASDYAAIKRSYRRSGSLDANERSALFLDRLTDYGATLYRCSSAEVATTVQAAVEQRGKKQLLIAGAIPDEWLPASIGFVRDENLSYAELDRSEGVMTGCALAIAETGTIVLRHASLNDVSGNGRRALTLIPDYHLCVVRSGELVETVAEGIRTLAALGTAPLTTISGPSATSDIEMTRVNGVHGPRVLDVVLIDDQDLRP